MPSRLGRSRDNQSQLPIRTISKAGSSRFPLRRRNSRPCPSRPSAVTLTRWHRQRTADSSDTKLANNREPRPVSTRMVEGSFGRPQNYARRSAR